MIFQSLVGLIYLQKGLKLTKEVCKELSLLPLETIKDEGMVASYQSYCEHEFHREKEDGELSEDEDVEDERGFNIEEEEWDRRYNKGEEKEEEIVEEDSEKQHLPVYCLPPRVHENCSWKGTPIFLFSFTPLLFCSLFL